MSMFREVKQLAPKDASRNQVKMVSLRDIRRIELSDKLKFVPQQLRRMMNHALARNRNLRRRLLGLIE